LKFQVELFEMRGASRDGSFGVPANDFLEKVADFRAVNRLQLDAA
jgi:hypothetical protein